MSERPLTMTELNLREQNRQARYERDRWFAALPGLVQQLRAYNGPQDSFGRLELLLRDAAYSIERLHRESYMVQHLQELQNLAVTEAILAAPVELHPDSPPLPAFGPAAPAWPVAPAPPDLLP